MMSQRGLQLASRQPPQVAAARPAVSMNLARVAAPQVSLVAKRHAGIASQKAVDVDQNSGMQILYNQRLHRPVSPHLGIYKWQVTWILSSLNRITGSVLSGGLYVFGALYLAAPLLGLKITAAGMAAGFAKWPVILKFLAKFTTASFFNFHSLNGLRHLAWDAGKQITNVQVIRTGWAVVGLSALLSLGMALY